MISLESLFNKYREFNFSDFEIIELFFVKNHLEDEAVKMLAELVEKRTKFLNEKIDYFKEDLMSCQSILYNQEMKEADKRDFFTLATRFTYMRNLDDEELEQAKQIISRNKITLCPVYFGAYLKSKGIEIKGWCVETFLDYMEKVIERRDG